MKKYISVSILFFLISCTSNTIFEKPKDLIPKDTMSLIIQELMIASSAKFIKTKKSEKNINYIPFVYDKFKIDSSRFESSNFYYISKIDVYEKIIEDAKNNLEKRKEQVMQLEATMDSIRRDSIKKVNTPLVNLDSINDVEDIQDKKKR